MTPRYYIDTSVLGGHFDAEFAEPTRAFWNDIHSGRTRILFSTVVVDEVVDAPTDVRRPLTDPPGDCHQVLAVTDEARSLAGRYIEAGVFTENYEADATHVAVRTVSAAKALVRWNFRNLVNLRRVEGFNGVNLPEGDRAIDVRTPREVIAS